MNKAKLRNAIQRAGGYSSVARELGLTKQVIWSWVNVLRSVPAERVMELETVLHIPRHEIRPDIYPLDRE